MIIPRRRFAYTLLGIAVATAVATGFWLLRVDGNRGELNRGEVNRGEINQPLQPDAIWSSYDPGRPAGGLAINYPFDGAVFPPRIIAPTFLWEDSSQESDSWLVHVQMPDEAEAICVESPEQEWRPSEEQWATIQQRSTSCPTEVTVLGVDRSGACPIVSSASISISTCPDEIGAPIFYREVNLPFRDAVKDPSHIRWRFGDVASCKPPSVVLQNLPVCGNCHSFSADGRVFGMDVDYANDKGSYAILDVRPEMALEPSKLITWSDFRREDGQETLGLLSQVSPDGKYVASTVKDDTVFVPRPDLAFSQLFFPIKGIVAIYSREKKTFQGLPGADDPEYVQSNPVWSPDGKWIVFARSERYHHKGPGRIGPQEHRVFTEQGRTFLFDLYRVPFNDGQGGRAEPLSGASQNGMSNYFARYSPDGKWIVFCRARTFMLLQPDSELYIIPSSGGEARRLRCNTCRMNSWHSFSPNGKWMVFSSKAFSPYTQLFVTHFDEAGNSSPAVLLANFTEEGRAANIPEFVHADPGAIRQIHEEFLDAHSYVRQGTTNVKFGDFARAEELFRKALEVNPKSAGALCNLGTIEAMKGRIDQATKLYREALKSDPDNFEANYSLGAQLTNMGRTGEAIPYLKEAVRADPDSMPAIYYLGLAYQSEAKYEQAITHYMKLLEAEPDFAPALTQLAIIRSACPQKELRDNDAAVAMAERACRLTDFSQPEILATLARVYATVGRHSEAITVSQRAVMIARTSGQEALARQIEREVQQDWRQPPLPDAEPK